MKRLWTRTGMMVAVIAAAALTTPAVAGAAEQHQNANMYAYWNFHGRSGFWNVDQQVRVAKKAHHTYWAMTFDFTTTPGQGGYTGLQTNGIRFNGSTGETAIFSLWNADATRGAQCGTFDGEGNGHSCRIPYSIDTNTYYRYRVWRLDADAGGQWWGAWIQNTRTGKDTQIGQIRVSGGKRLLGPPMNFSEYWGDAKSCDGVPLSTAYFTQPAANSRGNGRYDFGSVFASSARSTCTGGTTSIVTVGTTRAAKINMGGHR